MQISGANLLVAGQQANGAKPASDAAAAAKFRAALEGAAGTSETSQKKKVTAFEPPSFEPEPAKAAVPAQPAPGQPKTAGYGQIQPPGSLLNITI